MKKLIDQRNIGGLIIAVSTILFASYLPFQHQIIRFFELTFSSDQHITPHGVRELTSIYFFAVVLLFGIGFILIKAQNETWLSRIKQIFLEEPLCCFEPVRPSNRVILIVSLLTGIFLVINMRLGYLFPSIYPFFYAKDRGMIDLFVPVTMIISGLLLWTAVWRLWKEPEITSHRSFLIVPYLIIMVLFFFDAGEEISWGQDFFRWRTPNVFSGNVENQTNIHNYFNAYFDYGYIALSLVMVVILVSVWLEFNQRFLPFNRLFLPHASLIGLGLLIAFVSVVWYNEQELLEELVASFALFYSLRICICFRSKSLKIRT